MSKPASERTCQHGIGQPCGCKVTKAVALVLVPGIMGSRLKNRESGKTVWDPAAGQGDYETGMMRAIREARSPLLIRALESNFKTALQENKPPNDPEEYRKLLVKYHRIQSMSAVERWIEYKSETYQDQEYEVILQKILNAERKKEFLKGIAPFFTMGPAKRKRLLVNPKENAAIDRKEDLLDVDEGSDEYFRIFTSVKPIDFEDRRWRGWGEVLWGSYGPTLRFLEQMLVPSLEREIKNIKFSTFAIGYNWMQSNRKSGLRIKRKVEEYKQFLAERHQLEFDQIKVIMITHSMGGIATRSACVLDDMECDAVIHGAMPTHGSPATYYNAHCGYPLPASIALGSSAASVSATLGFCQGGLELLPNQHYVDSKGNSDWLKIENPDGTEFSISAQFPEDKIYDFYRDSEKWYSFINTQLLAPEKEKAEKLNYIDSYIYRIKESEVFHRNLASDFHPHTTMIYSCNGDQVHGESLEGFASHDNCRWRLERTNSALLPAKIGHPDDWQFYLSVNYPATISKKSDAQYNQRQLQKNRYNPRSISIKIQRAYLARAEAPGDGTVQIGSGVYADSGKYIKKIPLEAEETHQKFWQSETAMKALEQRVFQLAKAIKEGSI